jgi:hypothetical protein
VWRCAGSGGRRVNDAIVLVGGVPPVLGPAATSYDLGAAGESASTRHGDATRFVITAGFARCLATTARDCCQRLRRTALASPLAPRHPARRRCCTRGRWPGTTPRTALPRPGGFPAGRLRRPPRGDRAAWPMCLRGADRPDLIGTRMPGRGAAGQNVAANPLIELALGANASGVSAAACDPSVNPSAVPSQRRFSPKNVATGLALKFPIGA